MKILFITHCHGNYGASKSLQLLIKNYRGHDISLIVPKSLKRYNNLDEIKKFYGSHIRQVEEYFLPFKYCYMGSPKERYLVFKNSIRNLIWSVNKKKLINKLRTDSYDIIHLNAPVLYPLITRDFPFVVHIRDVILENQKNAFERLQQAKGLIFIDEGTKNPFDGINLNNSMVLNNPFDMRAQKVYNSKQIMDEYQLSPESIILSCIGRIKGSKGVKFIIQAFLKSVNRDLRLLIFGNGDHGSNYVNECRELAQDDKRVFFMGEEQDINKVYKISDYIVRGDPWHLIGRTVFEGLFADCDVIIPCNAQDINNNCDLVPFKNKVWAYTCQRYRKFDKCFKCYKIKSEQK